MKPEISVQSDFHAETSNTSNQKLSASEKILTAFSSNFFKKHTTVKTDATSATVEPCVPFIYVLKTEQLNARGGVCGAAGAVFFKCRFGFTTIK